MCILYLQNMCYSSCIPANFPNTGVTWREIFIQRVLGLLAFPKKIRSSPKTSGDVRRPSEDFRTPFGYFFVQDVVHTKAPLSVIQRTMRCVTEGKGLYNVRVSRPGIEFCCFCHANQHNETTNWFFVLSLSLSGPCEHVLWSVQDQKTSKRISLKYHDREMRSRPFTLS